MNFKYTIFGLSLAILAFSSSCVTEDAYVEVVGEAIDELFDGSIAAHVFSNGNRDQVEKFENWLQQVAKEDLKLQSENLYFQEYLESGSEKYNWHISYMVTLKDKTSFDRFKQSIVDNDIRASVSYPSYQKPLPNSPLEIQLMQKAIEDAKTKISAITGKSNPEIISITQLDREFYGEYGNEVGKVTKVRVRAKR